MPGSQTTQSPCRPRDTGLQGVAFRYANSVGTLFFKAFAAQWLACRFPCQRFATHLTAPHA
jgi:hypothetical protein